MCIVVGMNLAEPGPRRSMKESEPQYDDGDVEITDLDASNAGYTPPRLVTRLGLLLLDRHYRRPVTFATAAVALLAVVLILVNTVLVRTSGSGSELEPPAQPGQSSNYTYIIQANPPWGHLFVDEHAARLYPDQGFKSIMLSAGRHKLTWQARPFTDQQCTITVPPQSGVDTCVHPEFTMINSASVDTVIVFQAALNLLKPETRAALIQIVQETLDGQQSGEMVQPGEVYAISSLTYHTSSKPCVLTQDESAALCYQSANQPLRATVSFQLDTDTSPSAPCIGGTCNYNGEDCRLFCDAPAYDTFFAPPPSSHWDTFAIVHIVWHYYTSQGQLVTPAETDSFIWGQQDEHLVPFSISWDGASWHVVTRLDSAPPQSNPMCDAAMADTGTLLYSDAHTSFSFDSIPAPSPALGCLIKIQQVSLPETPTPSSPVPAAYLLHRFGVLLAVNDAAHRLLPFLPLADAYETRLAKQLGG